MKGYDALLLAIPIAGCAMNVPPHTPLGTWGTDAHITASTPTAHLRYADHPRGTAELRIPDGSGPFPLAVIFHGGCWKAGIADAAYMAPLATRWQHQGAASLNVDYREVGDGGGWPGSFADWAAAAWLIDTVAREYPIDTTRITLVGHSAGALPALWLPRRDATEGPLGERAPIPARAAIILDGPGDVAAEQPAFDALCEFSAVAPFMAGHDAAPIAPAPQLSEVLFVQAKLPPPPPPVQQALQVHGAVLSIRENPGASHFAIITPGDPAYAANEPAMLAVLRGR